MVIKKKSQKKAKSKGRKLFRNAQKEEKEEIFSNRPKEEIYICAVHSSIHRALFHDRVDVYFAGTGSTQYTVVPALALALVVAPTTDAGGVFFVAVATNIFLSKEKQKRKKKKYPENEKCRNKNICKSVDFDFEDNGLKTKRQILNTPLRKDGAVGLVAPKMRLGPNRFQFCIDRAANASKINTGTRFAPTDVGTVVPGNH